MPTRVRVIAAGLALAMVLGVLGLATGLLPVHVGIDHDLRQLTTAAKQAPQSKGASSLGFQNAPAPAKPATKASLQISKIGVNAPIESVGTVQTRLGQQIATAQENPWRDVGNWVQAEKQSGGTLHVIVGHNVWWQDPAHQGRGDPVIEAVFWKLGELGQGDLIQVALPSGARNYRVVSVNQASSAHEVVTPRFVPGRDELVLYTCSGPTDLTRVKVTAEAA